MADCGDGGAGAAAEMLPMHVYCINVDARADRWARMQRVLEQQGLSEATTRVSATTPSDAGVREMLREYPDKRSAPPRRAPHTPRPRPTY